MNLERDQRAFTQARKRAQSAIEYAVLIAVIGATLVGMSIYAKRALSGRWRAVGDTFGYGRQYEPRTVPAPPLGRLWALGTEGEPGVRGGPWRGVWTRTGTDTFSPFSARWTHSIQPDVTATITVTRLSGREITLERTGSSDGNDCTYQGTIAEDGLTVSGTYTCTQKCGCGAGKCSAGVTWLCSWSAEIRQS